MVIQCCVMQNIALKAYKSQVYSLPSHQLIKHVVNMETEESMKAEDTPIVLHCSHLTTSSLHFKTNTNVELLLSPERRDDYGGS